MNFDPNNRIIQLCATGMTMEAQGKTDDARQLFMQAWTESTNDFEKFTSAHYVARHQNTIEDKLKWDKAALSFAIILNDESTKSHLPSLYLNIAKCYEDLNNFEAAKEQYRLAFAYSEFLPDDGYGKMIRSGIQNGIRRISEN